MNSLIAIAAVGFLFNSEPVFAYLDPGSGSYIIQVTIGLLAGALFMLKNYWVVIKGYVAKIFGKNKKQD